MMISLNNDQSQGDIIKSIIYLIKWVEKDNIPPYQRNMIKNTQNKYQAYKLHSVYLLK